MDPIYRYINYSSQDRLNDILDKISHLGKGKLSELELEFLDSYSAHQEEEMNMILKEAENDTIFESDDQLFVFKLDEIHRYSDQVHLIGTIKVPDMQLRGKKIEGVLYGKIIFYRKDQFAIDFSDGKHDIFEFCSGIEYELDIFIDEIIKKVKF
jgi:hypothetical protein